MQFIEGGIEKDADSSDEESEDEGHSSELNKSDISGVESLHLVEQVFFFWTSRAGVLFVSFHSNEQFLQSISHNCSSLTLRKYLIDGMRCFLYV
jgi:hypothetical protein